MRRWLRKSDWCPSIVAQGGLQILILRYRTQMTSVSCNNSDNTSAAALIVLLVSWACSEACINIEYELSQMWLLSPKDPLSESSPCSSIFSCHLPLTYAPARFHLQILQAETISPIKIKWAEAAGRTHHDGLQISIIGLWSLCAGPRVKGPPELIAKGQARYNLRFQWDKFRFV